MTKKTLTRAYILGLSAWILSFVLALKYGAVAGAGMEIVTQLRLPRAILASAVGIGLSVAGVALQSLFANPLCEPYTLGISSGSALGAVLGIALGIEWSYAGLAGTAFLGALLFAFILYLFSLKTGSNNVMLLLTGVMLGFLGSSVVALWMALGDPSGVQGAVFWLLGDLSRARLAGSIFSFIAVVILSVPLWLQWRSMDALLLGEEGALAMGISVMHARKKIILLTSLLVGICVSASGMIGFVGLIIPHFVRFFVGSLHFRLIPLCAIWGAAVLTAADTLARVVAQPFEIPVGVVTAIIGVPIFLWVMIRRRRFS